MSVTCFTFFPSSDHPVTLLVTSFIYQDCSEFQLHVVVIQTYADGQLNYLSEPETQGGTPIMQTMAIHFMSLDMYRHHVMFFREEHS